MVFTNFKCLIVIDTDNWQDRKIICSCTDYLKNNICIHVLALAVILTVAKFPLEAKNTQLRQLKKKGRPSMAKKALLTQ